MPNLRITELDFDQIKSNLRTFLQNQAEFTDYDFEGSGLSVLLDILAYNTHYNAYLANMLANEMFLDSAVKRSSIVSLAKHLGYVPRSTTGSRAVLDITVTSPPGTPAVITMERYTPFTTQINGTAYTFLTLEPYTTTPVGGIYTFGDVTVKEGTLLQYSYTVVTPGPDEKYEIPNDSVDTSTLFVTVQNSSSDATITSFTMSNGIVDVDSSSNVYFLEENSRGQYQIYFGDGIVGKKLIPGNIVRIQYLVSTGDTTNVSGLVTQSFTAGSAIAGSNNITVDVVSNSTGGANKESISSIKFNAPRTYTAKNRAVTKNDYIALIKSQYSMVESISVWGGEENVPPAYGKVFISLKPYAGFNISSDVENNIKNTILKERQVLTVTPEFIEPDYIYLNFIIEAKVNKNLTSYTNSQISSLIRAELNTYFQTSLQQFEKPFYFSQLLGNLSGVDNSVVSVLAEIKAQKRITPVLNVSNAYIDENTLKFNNRLHPGALQSTRFQISRNNTVLTVRVKDVPDVMPVNYSGTGTIRLYNVVDNADLGSIGSINYATGDVTITNIVPLGYPSDQYDIAISCGVQESSYDINVSRNQIIVIDDNLASSAADRLQGVTINVTTVQ
jgi:hypothetical protein